MKIKRLLAINVPIKVCNLKCEYCYISALGKNGVGPAKFEYSPEHVGNCLSTDRLGGVCIINLTGGGETLLPPEMPSYIYHLLLQGHYLEVVTNGTLTERFEEISKFPKELLKRLEFKFSFHYTELKNRNLFDKFFYNVDLMRKSGCSFTIELMPNDSLLDQIPDIMVMCNERFGAKCQVTVGRNDLTQKKELLTNLSREEYESTWGKFDSPMFKFKLDIFNKKRTEFCYAGAWSLYIDLGTGAAKPCYGQMSNQNVFENLNKPILWEPVGKHCRQPYCYNGHAYLTLGVIPELNVPTYSDIRNRDCFDGTAWLSPEVKEAFSSKLNDSNLQWTEKEKKKYENLFCYRFIKTMIYDYREIYTKVLKRIIKR